MVSLYYGKWQTCIDCLIEKSFTINSFKMTLPKCHKDMLITKWTLKTTEILDVLFQAIIFQEYIALGLPVTSEKFMIQGYEFEIGLERTRTWYGARQAIFKLKKLTPGNYLIRSTAKIVEDQGKSGEEVLKPLFQLSDLNPDVIVLAKRYPRNWKWPSPIYLQIRLELLMVETLKNH